MDIFIRWRIDQSQEESSMLKWTLYHLGQPVSLPPPTVWQFVENMQHIIDEHILRFFAIRSESFRKILSHACILHMMLTNIFYNFVLLLSSYLKHFWVVHYDNYAIFQQIELYRIFLIKALWGSNTIWTFLFVCLLFTLTWYQSVKTMYYNILNASTIEKKIIS